MNRLQRRTRENHKLFGLQIEREIPEVRVTNKKIFLSGLRHRRPERKIFSDNGWTVGLFIRQILIGTVQANSILPEPVHLSEDVEKFCPKINSYLILAALRPP